MKIFTCSVSILTCNFISSCMWKDLSWHLRDSAYIVLLFHFVCQHRYCISVSDHSLRRLDGKKSTKMRGDKNFNYCQCKAYLWNTYGRIVRYKEHRKFYSRCINEKITPIGLRWKPNLGFNFNLEDDVDFRTHVKEFKIESLKKVRSKLKKEINYTILQNKRRRWLGAAPPTDNF